MRMPTYEKLPNNWQRISVELYHKVAGNFNICTNTVKKTKFKYFLWVLIV